MKTQKIKFRKGDWIGTTQIPVQNGRQYMMARVQKVLGQGKRLLVEYGSYCTETIVEAKTCKLIKRN